MDIISKLLNLVKHYIFYVVLLIIVLIFFIDRISGIWLAGSFFVIYFLSYLISHSSKRRLIRSIRNYLIISDKEIAAKLNRPLEDIKSTLFSLSKNQRKKKWLIVYLNQRYLFLNDQAVKHFELLYYKGYNEKRMLESLQHKMRIKSRAEVKAIVTTLTDQNRITAQTK